MIGLTCERDILGYWATTDFHEGMPSDVVASEFQVVFRDVVTSDVDDNGRLQEIAGDLAAERLDARRSIAAQVRLCVLRDLPLELLPVRTGEFADSGESQRDHACTLSMETGR